VPASRPQARVNLELHNEGPIVVAMDSGSFSVRSGAHRWAVHQPHSHRRRHDTGYRATEPSRDGNINLVALEALSPNIFSAGKHRAECNGVRGTAKPVVNGRLQLQNASFNMVDAPNGISNANGTVTFNGTEAVIRI